MCCFAQVDNSRSQGQDPIFLFLAQFCFRIVEKKTEIGLNFDGYYVSTAKIHYLQDKKDCYCNQLNEETLVFIFSHQRAFPAEDHIPRQLPTQWTTGAYSLNL